MNKQNIKLKAPGAGLPFFQRLLLKIYYGPFVSKRDPWAQLERSFVKVYSSILREIESLSETELNQVVLVKPLPGIEDSSRNWSIAMTLEHLVIVGEGIKQLILELSHGRTIPVTVDIAQFKPLKKKSATEALTAMIHFRDNSINEINSKIGDRKSPATHIHPWFGPINAHQWFWLLSSHGFLHLRQIREIKKGLKAQQ